MLHHYGGDAIEGKNLVDDSKADRFLRHPEDHRSGLIHRHLVAAGSQQRMPGRMRSPSWTSTLCSFNTFDHPRLDNASLTQKPGFADYLRPQSRDQPAVPVAIAGNDYRGQMRDRQRS